MEEKLAILVPYRNRATHLEQFLAKLPSYLASQAIPHKIFIVEQINDKPFNRGKLLNVGFQLIKEEFDYFCFHDVDMLPIQADYSYVDIPTHLAAEVSQFHKEEITGLPYHIYFGGVTLFNREDFLAVNGFSNDYWGYGAEDDDLLLRVVRNNLQWMRRPGIFESLSHAPTSGTREHEANKQHFLDVYTDKLFDFSGLSDLTYTLKKQEKHPDYHLLAVEI